MSFLQNVRDELSQPIGRGFRPQAPDLRPVLAELLEHGCELDPVNNSNRSVRWAMREWDPEKLNRLGTEIAERVRSHWPSMTPEELGDTTKWTAYSVLSNELEITPKEQAPTGQVEFMPSLGRRTVLRAIGTEALAQVRSSSSAGNGQTRPADYCRELGLVVSDGVSAAGRVLLQLHGRDAVRWLLALELSRSTGINDEWRCSPEEADWFIANPKVHWPLDEEYDDDETGFSWATVRRMFVLGVLSDNSHPQSNWSGFDLTTLGKSILSEHRASEPSPMLSLANSLSADVTARALRELGPNGWRAGEETVEQAIAEQTRNLVHELRNKLSPLQNAMEVLVKAIPGANRTDSTSTASTMAERIIKELFSFVDTTEELSRGMRAPQEWFGLGKALQEAAASGRNGRHDARIDVDPTFQRVELHGPRFAFVTAMANLVRNSIQSTPESPPEILVRLTIAEDVVDLCVDDNGPGVAPELQARIFDPGFSTRPGGSGQGLDLVRTTIERYFGGRVKYSNSSLGGAGFRVSLDRKRIRQVEQGTQSVGGTG